MFAVNFADGYYIERNGEGVIDLAVQSEDFANFVCGALNKAEAEEYVERLKIAYDPHDLLNERVKAVSKISRDMEENGYDKDQIKSAANAARKFWNLSLI